jgi:hypothetical protein
MDYSKNIEAHKASDLAYAKWYEHQPEERKAQMVLSGYNFIAERIKYDMAKENPFATQAEILQTFVEVTQKDAYPPDIFSYIQEKFAERSEQEWKQRFRNMKKHFGWTYDDMARYIGAESGNSLKASVSRKLPAFAKLAVCVFEATKEK